MIESIWYEKYAPEKLDDVILPASVKTRFRECVNTGRLPNLGFWSQEPGLGKTSTAKALIRTLDAEALFVNASLEKGIDLLRSKLLQFASSKSLSDSPKIIVLDECDNITRDAQQAFRGFLDEFSGNCSFIFTGNYKSKIIEPLLSRLENYDFVTFPKSEMVKPVFERLKHIVESEGVVFDDNVKSNIVRVIQNFYPKIRDMIKCLQKSISNGKFVVEEESTDFDKIVDTMKQKDYSTLIQQVNCLSNPDTMYEFLYKNFDKFSKIPQAVVIIAKYQFQTEQVRDKNLNLCACLVELINCL